MSDEISGGNTGAVTSGDVSGGASPASHTESLASGAGSAEQSTQPTGSTDNTEREAFIPRTRFDEVNTRKAELERKLQQLQWAESVKREDLESMASWYSSYRDDPADFLERAYQETLNHPIHGPVAKSRVGRMLASMRQAQAQQQAAPEPIPTIPIVNERNEPVGDLGEIVKRILGQEIAPLKQDYETRQQTAQREKERADIKAQAEAQADQDVAYVTSRPWFAAHKADILETFKANPRMSIREAADHVLDTKVLPTYGQKAEAKVLSDLQLKANAQTVNPGTPSGSAKPSFKSFKEAAEYYDKHPDEAAAAAG